MKTMFWWNIPCQGMINVLKAYAEEVDTTTLVVTGELSASRKAMGWKDNGKLFNNHIILSEKEWGDYAFQLLNKYKDRLHVFNGITYTPRMKRLIDYAILNNIAFCNMSEAYFNLEKGFRKMLKSLFISTVLPSKVRTVSLNSRGVICLSGGSDRDMAQFNNFGFKKVFPFGYFTDIKTLPTQVATNDNKVHIICPGLLEYYKGVDILIHALSILDMQGIQNFCCHITGNGEEKKSLIKLCDRLNLNNKVIFEGVLDADRYNCLLNKIDILVAPGRIEPWGIRINEAIQRGNVVLVSDGIGANQLIRESQGGAVFKSGSAKDLADKLKLFLLSSKELNTAKRKNIEYSKSISSIAQAKRLKLYINEML